MTGAPCVANVPSRNYDMTDRLSYRIATLPVLAVAGLLLASYGLAKLGWTGAGMALVAVWTYGVVVEMHRVLPVTFFESRETFEATFLRDLVLTAGGVVVASYKSFAQALGMTFGVSFGVRAVGFAVLLGLCVYLIVLSFRIVRHVLSAVATLEAGTARVAPTRHVVLGLLFSPLYVFFTHARIRALLADG